MTKRIQFDGAGRRRSLGQKLLLRAVRASSRAAVASKCRVDASTISRLASGKSTTDKYSLRKTLEKELSIPMNSWDEPDETIEP